jgi:hypothetical protein
MMSDNVAKDLLIGFIKYVGTFLGPTILVMLLYKIFEPFAFRDGQFILVFMLSIPVGVILSAGLFISDIARNKKQKGIWPLLVSGASVITLSVELALFSASTRGLTLAELMKTATSPDCMSPMLFGVAFILAGVIKQQKRRN